MNLPNVLLHTGGAYPSGWLNSDWRPEPGVIIGVFAIIAAYIWWTGPKNRDAQGNPIHPVSTGQRVAFVLGSLIVLVALNPPLDDWSGSYLLSAHMFQHMLLMFAVAPLWLGGMPEWLLRKIVSRGPIVRIGYAVTRPVVALAVSSVITTLWHLPFAYDAALGSEPIHIVQHASFLFAALLGLWPVMGRLAEWPGIGSPLNCLYLFLASIPGGVVGAFITLAAPGIYEGYTNAPRIWGMSLATDQEIAGLLMWVFGSTLYLLAITVFFFQWAGREEEKERRGGSTAPAGGADLNAGKRLDSVSTGQVG